VRTQIFPIFYLFKLAIIAQLKQEVKDLKDEIRRLREENETLQNKRIAEDDAVELFPNSNVFVSQEKLDQILFNK